MNGPADPLNYLTFDAETRKEKYANPYKLDTGAGARFYPETVGI